MKNYICIDGNKTELTDAQLRELGFTRKPTVAEVAAIVRSGKAREHFKVHDIISLCGYDLEVIGFDHDKDSNDPSRSTITLMAKSLLPARRMHSGACKKGWIDTELRKWLNTEFVKQLPEELVKHIPAVLKSTHSSDGEVFETSDRLFLPSESELFGSAIWSDYEDGPRYEAFATSEARVRVDEDGDADWYWSRSFVGGGSAACAAVDTGGNANYYTASGTAIRAPLCFCLA